MRKWLKFNILNLRKTYPFYVEAMTYYIEKRMFNNHAFICVYLLVYNTRKYATFTQTCVFSAVLYKVKMK